MDQFALSTRGKQQFKAEWRSLTHVLTVVSYGSEAYILHFMTTDRTILSQERLRGKLIAEGKKAVQLRQVSVV